MVKPVNGVKNINEFNDMEENQLFSDILNGRFLQAQQKINAGFDPNIRNQDGTHLLVFALRYGTKDLVKNMLQQNTIDLNKVLTEIGQSLFEIVNNDSEMAGILERYSGNFSNSNSQLKTHASNYYAQIMQAGILWNAISNNYILQNIEPKALMNLLQEIGEEIISLFKKQNKNEDNLRSLELEDNQITKEENDNLQQNETSLENKKIKELLVEMILNHIQNQCDDSYSNIDKIPLLNQCICNLKGFLQNTIKIKENSHESVQEDELAFIYLPDLTRKDN